jgi:hypothetical protein
MGGFAWCSFFWQYWSLKDFTIARQVLYHLNYNSSPGVQFEGKSSVEIFIFELLNIYTLMNISTRG